VFSHIDLSLESQEKDMQFIALARDQSKKSVIASMLNEAITSEHTIQPSLGKAEYFEFLFQNPFLKQTLFTIDVSDPELRVVLSADEWLYLSRMAKTGCKVEERLFSVSPDGKPQFLLHAGEKLMIPFKFQSFVSGIEPNQASMSHRPAHLRIRGLGDGIARRTIQAKVSVEESGPIVAQLHVKIEPRSHIVDQTAHFWNPEHQFFNKLISLNGVSPFGDLCAVKCSNSDVIVDWTNNRERHVKLKCFCGPAPDVLYICLVAYADPFLATPVKIIQIFVHSVVRLFETVNLGEVSRSTITFHASSGSRSVQCFSSCPEELLVCCCQFLSVLLLLSFRSSPRVLSRSWDTRSISWVLS
jgi:hypothetical protein